MRRKGGGKIDKAARDKLPKEGSEDYISLQQRKKELKGQAVSGPVRAKNDMTMDKPRTTLKGKGSGASAAMRKRLDKVKL